MLTLIPNSVTVRLTTEKGATVFTRAPSGPLTLALVAALRGPQGPAGPPGPEGGTALIVSPTPPLDPVIGTLWLDIS